MTNGQKNIKNSNKVQTKLLL